MTRPVLTWRGLAIGGDGPYRIQSIGGWEDLPPSDSYSVGRARGHGEHIGQQFAAARTVTVKGVLVDRGHTDGLVPALEAATPLAVDDLHDLAVTVYGRTLTAPARVERRSLPQDLGYGVGLAQWALQWTCPDPLRYGEPLATSTALPASGGGLAYPLAYPLAYGALGDTGQMVLANEGTADAGVVFDVVGPLPAGFELSAAGARITYSAEVPAGQVITIDTAAGSVLAEGTADRRGKLTAADWLLVPAGRSLTVQFTSLGAVDPAAHAWAQWKPAFW